MSTKAPYRQIQAIPLNMNIWHLKNIIILLVKILENVQQNEIDSLSVYFIDKYMAIMPTQNCIY